MRKGCPVGYSGVGRRFVHVTSGRARVGVLVAAWLIASQFVAPAAQAADPTPKPGRLLGEGQTTKSLVSTASVVPNGFTDSPVLTGLTQPIAGRVSPDGRVFVAEKSGIIKVFPSLSSSTPTVVADLRTQVDNYWDRGLLGFTLDPNFPTNPYIYVLYAYDALIGGTP